MKLSRNAGILVGFLPYLAFFAVARAVSDAAGLWAALVTALVIALRNWSRTHSLKYLEIGSTLLFAVLAVLTAATGLAWSVMTLRLVIDSGLLAIALSSLAVGQPFTLQYARERVPAAYREHPGFLRINRHITWAWVAAFAILVAAHAIVVLIPGTPVWIDIAASIAALAGAVGFTTWYPAAVARRAGITIEPSS